MRVTAEMLKAAGWVRKRIVCWGESPYWAHDTEINAEGNYYQHTFHEAAAIYKQQREKKDV